MNTYIFNVTAIVTDRKATGHGYTNHPKAIKAHNIDEALEIIQEELKPNSQFKFEWAYAGKEEV